MRILLAAIILVTAPVSANAQEKPPILVELFTSQGCYSCPPADEVLGELGSQDDVIALGYHVTYWDRLGWPDTLGLEASTNRQYWYRGKIRSRGVYTPQMVIGGQYDVVGSNRRQVGQLLAIARDNPPALIEVGLRGDTLELAASAGIEDDHLLQLVVFDKQHVVDIPRGENGGKTLKYHYVVRNIVRTDGWPNDQNQIRFDIAVLELGDDQGIAVFAQDPANGKILAAGQYRPW